MATEAYKPKKSKTEVEMEKWTGDDGNNGDLGELRKLFKDGLRCNRHVGSTHKSSNERNQETPESDRLKKEERMISLVERLSKIERNQVELEEAFRKMGQAICSINELVKMLVITVLEDRNQGNQTGCCKAETSETTLGLDPQQTQVKVSTGRSEGKKFRAPCKERPCRFCDAVDHSANACIRPLEEKIQAVHRKALCCNCLREDHAGTKCKSRYSCLRCKGRHYTGICTLTPDGKQHHNILSYLHPDDDDQLETQLFYGKKSGPSGF